LAAESNLGFALIRANLPGEAETLLREVVASERRDNGQTLLATARENLAAALTVEHKYAAAVIAAQEALDIARKNSGEATAPVAIALRVLAETEEFEGDMAHAEAHFRAAYDLGEKLHAQRISSADEWKVPLADFLVGQKRCDEAVPLLRGAQADRAESHVTEPISAGSIALLIASCEGKRGIADGRSAVESLRRIPAVEQELYPTSAALLAAAAKERIDR
jgi:tetratricopeptide (TPR) repeat protein